jgi:hypothetical protein
MKELKKQTSSSARFVKKPMQKNLERFVYPVKEEDITPLWKEI